MIWKYGACGEYTEYKHHVIIKQIHPNLERYLICKELENLELENITTASNLKSAKETINEINNHPVFD